MPNEFLKFEHYIDLKTRGVSALDASNKAYKKGLSNVLVIRMLRDVYGLSLLDAAKIAHTEHGTKGSEQVD